MKIYADNAATTKLDTDAFEAMKPYLLENYANPSGAYSFSKKAKRALEEARKTIAECINAEPEQIIFTSGGTESNNHAIKHFTVPSDICHVVTSVIEHHSVLYACENSRFERFVVPVNKYGVVPNDELEKILGRNRPVIASCDRTLVTIMTANNEIGTIQHISELSEIAHRYGAVFHTDAVQAVGHIPIDVQAMGIDILSASAHKFNGPKGIGFLYNKNGLLQPYHHGGYQEFGMRAGTENIPAIVGMAVALKKNVEDMEHNTEHLSHLTEVFLTVLRRADVDFILNGHPTERLPGNINISFKGRSGEGLMHMLDLKGICVSTGSACDSVNQQVSHVIKAINVSADYREGTIRVTFGKDNSEQEVVEVANSMIRIIGL
ncbi:MAG: cysteine desulfurase [Lachnospiraceae bacterium]|nr:cysteine desulfurase [Lachnospiraceae bacterium]MCM1227004.1 cysteine desulfurase [Clostridium sp.]